MLRHILQRLRPGAPPALASAYLREGRVFVQASDRTVWRTAGFWVSAGPVDSLAASDPPAVLGRAVLAALGRSRLEVPVPNDWKPLAAPLFKAMGVRSERASMQGTRYCSIEREPRTLKIKPHHNGGTSGEGRGYQSLGEAESFRLPADSPPEAVGQAVIAAFKRATL